MFSGLKDMALQFREAGGTLLCVGGAVRDTLGILGEGASTPKDIDLVLFGLDLDKAMEISRRMGNPRLVTRKVVLGGEPEGDIIHLRFPQALLEISVRRDPQGKAIPFSQDILRLDALNRDFTLNSIYQDTLSGEILDPLGGLVDLKYFRLRATGPKIFESDPLRLLRAFSLISRRGYHSDGALLELVRKSVPLLDNVSKSRVWPEWRAWSASRYPHLGLRFLRESGLIEYFPELPPLILSPQNWQVHPEGSVWNHTLLVVQAMSEHLRLHGTPRKGLSLDPTLLTLSALTHDLGKVLENRLEDGISGRGFYPQHAEKGVPLASRFLKSIRCPDRLREGILKLTRYHMEGSFSSLTAPRLRALARYLHPQATLADLWALKASDWNGRLYWPEPYPLSLDEFVEAVGGSLEPPEDLLSGSEVIDLFGLREGTYLGKMLQLLRDSHDLGKISTKEDAISLLRKTLKRENCLRKEGRVS